MVTLLIEYEKGVHKHMPPVQPPCALSARISTPKPNKHTPTQAYYRMSSGQITFTSNTTTTAPQSPGVDAYGWAVLDRMRDQSNVCIDWCGEAMKQLGVHPHSHQHFVCFPLYKPDQAPGAPAVCDNACPGNGECGASCPADGPYSDLPGVR